MLSDSKQPQRKLTVSEAFTKLHKIRHGLEMLRDDLHSNIEALSEDPDFQDRMQDLQRDTQERAEGLEEEVKRLRSDVQSIKDLLDEDTEKKSADSG